MKAPYPISLLVFLLLMVSAASAQRRDDDLVQFSGVVVTADSLRPVPYTSISILKSNRGPPLTIGVTFQS